MLIITCGSCGKIKEKYQDRTVCRECHNEKARQRAAAERHRKKNSNYKHRYGLNLEEVEEAKRIRRGRCDICGEIPRDGLVVDHNHADGSFRGMLCQNHNKMLGTARDNIDILRKAIKYLKKSRRKET